VSPVLEFENITRSYKKGVPVLNGVSFAIGEGEVVGLLGRNGAGKTTLIRIAMGLLYPHNGSVRVFGVSPTMVRAPLKARLGSCRGQEAHRLRGRRPGSTRWVVDR
jgi:ABC-type multidrug transport system ATPase subunit